MKTGRSFHTNIYPVRVFAFVSLVSLLMLKGSMPAQDAGVWTAVLPALIVYPHIVYLLSIVRPKEPLSIGGAFSIDALVVGCSVSLPGMPPLLGAGLIYLMLLTLVICLPWRSPFLLPSVAGLLLTLAVQIAAADALWLVLTPFELGAVVFVAGYLLIIGHTVCQRGLKLGAMRRIQGSKWHSLVAEHARALHLLPNHHLTKEKVAKHRSVHLVVLFSDMCDFTAWSAGLSAQALAAQLDTYLECVAELVSHEGGILDKFLGDGLMVIFEAELHDHRRQRQNAESATRLAGALHKCHAAWSGTEPSLPVTFPALRVGIHAGPALLGRFGGGQREHFTAAGTTINVAARLCAEAGPFETLISEQALTSSPDESDGVWRSLMPRGLNQCMRARSVHFQWPDSDIMTSQAGKRL
jgi:class 3 adenylate cyclase